MHISAIVRNSHAHHRVVSSSSEADVANLLRETDAVAEIYNMLRAGVAVLRDP